MADRSISFKNPNASAPPLTHHLHRPSKPSNLLCKSFIIILVLLLVPFIPSQAPDFIITRSSIFTKVWDLLHLLFIGLVVCYGLFSKRSSSSNVEVENHQTVGDNTNSQAYLNGILDVSSFFEDGLENVCWYDEKKLILQSGLSGNVNNSSSLLSENGGCNLSDKDEEKVSKTWNLMYSRGESVVVVANDEWGKPILGAEHKPLNLPIRSLRSRVKAANKSEEENDTLESTNDAKRPVQGKIRGMLPVNLGKKFERVAEPAPTVWRSRSRSRSGKMQMREEEISNAKPTLRARPHSIGEMDFEVLKSRLIRQPKSSITTSSNMKMENLERVNEDVRGSSGVVAELQMNGGMPFVACNSGAKIEKLERKGVKGSSSHLVQGYPEEPFLACKSGNVTDNGFESREDVRCSTGTVAVEPRLNGDAPVMITSKSSRHLPVGLLTDITMKRNERAENLMETRKSMAEQPLVSERTIWSFFESDLESPRPRPPPPKVLSRGTSVRTFRSSKFVSDEIKVNVENEKNTDESSGKVNNGVEDASCVDEVQGGEKLRSSQVSARAHEPTISEIQSEDKQEVHDTDNTQMSEENSANLSDHELESNIDESSEVDRKAGEFIAKFREQIRLQKLASIKRHKDC